MSQPVETKLARRYRWQVNIGTTAVPVWATVFGITDFKPTLSPGMQDDSDYETDGWDSSTKTSQGWMIEATILLKGDDSDLTPALIKLRDTAELFGTSGIVEVRWMDKNGLPEAYQGSGFVEYSRANSGNKDLDAATVKITGRGARTKITNPIAGSTVPGITSLVPAAGGTAAGGLVTINGANFTGATAVSFGGTAATNFTVVSDAKIVATKPALTAGTKEVTVTTPAGTNPTPGSTANDFVVS